MKVIPPIFTFRLIRIFLNASLSFIFLSCDEGLRTEKSKVYQDVGLSDYVNIFMGTAGDHGQLSPAASLPFGMVKLGPETNPTNHSGYDYNAKKIKGFSHNRSEGVGCTGAGGNILIKPGTGPLKTLHHYYSKESEKASPGYYEVILKRVNTSLFSTIKAELTVTNGTGWHRYTYSSSSNNWLMIDLSASHAPFIAEEHRFNNNQELSGSIQATTVCRKTGGKYKFFYNLIVDKNVKKVEASGHKLYLFFEEGGSNIVNVKVSLSTISPEQAKKDRTVEIAHASFEEIKTQAMEKWESKLGKILVEGEEETKALFYTNLYRSYLAPYNTTSTDGTYRGSDGKIYNADNFTFYHGWSVWDNFRTQLPLLTIIEPETMQDICRSLVELYKQGKYKWASPTEPYPTVRTEHTSIVLLDAYKKGINNFSLESVYSKLVQEVDSLPYSSPDDILESSYDLWALSEISGIIGNKIDQERFLQKAYNYKDLWKDKFMIMNSNSDIMHGDGLYEGTLWQYRWFVTWDIPGIIEMIGGEKEFTKQLTQFFEDQLYNHGNQPDIQVPYFFNFSSTPWKTQEYVNRILSKSMVQWYGTHVKWEKPLIGNIYRNIPEGYLLEMDDDMGTMSAWFVLSSLGIYPLNVGEPVYHITTPSFNKIKIITSPNTWFTINAPEFSEDNFYIDSVYLNHSVLEGYKISHNDLLGDGLLEFKLMESPMDILQ